MKSIVVEESGSTGPSFQAETACAATRSPRRQLALTALIALAIAAASTGIAFQRRNAILDDTFIYARMVENVIAGRGWSYNHGAAQDLSTSPLYFLVLLGASAVTHDVLQSITLVFGATLGATSFLLFVHLRRSTGWVLAMLATLTFLHHPYVLDLNGTEILLLLALILATLWAYSQGRFLIAAGLLSLTVLARADAALLAIVILGHYVIVHRRIPSTKLIVAFLGLPLLWMIVHISAFHSITATSLQAKIAQGRSGLWILFHNGLWDWFFKNKPTNVWWGGMTCLGLVGPGIITAALRRDAVATLLWLTAVLHFVGYYWLGVPNYHWYFGIEFLAVLYLAGIGLSAGYRLVERKGWLRLEGGLLAIAWAVMAGICVNVTDFARAYRFMPSPSAAEYFEVAEQIRPFVKPGQSLLTPEIGILGWVFPDMVLEDTVGLTGFVTTTELAHGEFNAWLSRKDALPENVLLLDRFAGMMLNGDGRVAAKFGTYYKPVIAIKHANPLFCGMLYQRHTDAEAPSVQGDILLMYLFDETKLNPPLVTRMYIVVEEQIVPVFFQHPPSRVTVTVEITKRYLHFGYGLQPEAYDKSDGVGYSLEIKVHGMVEGIFDADVRPMRNLSDRAWQEANVDLGRFVGKTVELTLITKPLGNNNCDWSMWLNPRLSDDPSDGVTDTLVGRSIKSLEDATNSDAD